jgi:phosphatidate cytidylyltransferase
MLGALIGVLWWGAVLAWLWRPSFGSGDQHWAGSLKLLAGSLCVVPAWCALAWLHSQDPLGPRWALYALALVWAADSGAYFAGSRFGRRKLAPRISPGKSWEGVAGGVAGSMLLGALAFPLLGLGWTSLPALLLLTVLTAGISVVGDLFESLMKRHSGLKDSGAVLPGHGGLMDRLDSLLAALPVFAVGKAWLGL